MHKACSMQFFSKNLKGRGLLENLCMDFKIILQVVLRTNRLLSFHIKQIMYKMIQGDTQAARRSHKRIIFQNKEGFFSVLWH